MSTAPPPARSVKSEDGMIGGIPLSSFPGARTTVRSE